MQKQRLQIRRLVLIASCIMIFATGVFAACFQEVYETKYSGCDGGYIEYQGRPDPWTWCGASLNPFAGCNEKQVQFNCRLTIYSKKPCAENIVFGGDPWHKCETCPQATGCRCII